MAHAAVRGRLAAAGLAGVVLLAFALPAAARSYVVPGSPAAQQTACVEPTERMRRSHMELIRHQRDKTVRAGIRGAKHSLAGCVHCHVSYDSSGGQSAPQPIPVVAEGQFCQTCHAHAAVTLDCFQCHATVPTDERSATAAAGSGHGPRVAASEGEGQDR